MIFGKISGEVPLKWSINYSRIQSTGEKEMKIDFDSIWLSLGLVNAVEMMNASALLAERLDENGITDDLLRTVADAIMLERA